MLSNQLPSTNQQLSGAVPSSLQSALQMNPPPPMPIKQPSPNQETPPASTPTAGAKRRRKNEGGNEEGPQGPSEPRRLRRSHEACARCRGKKIKASPDCWHLPSVSPGAAQQRTELILSFISSAIPNIHDALPVLPLASSATKRTVTTDKH